MASSMIDSLLYRNVFSTEAMRKLFDDETIIQNWLDIEKALAETQAELGIIPKEAAVEIAKKADVKNLDIAEIEQGIMKIGHSLVPALRNFQRICDNDYGEYIHFGATTQDIIDTGFMMSIKKGFDIIYDDLRETEQAILDLIEKHGNAVMAGRTHAQQALPITFGYKAAVWASEVRRNIERMKDCRKRAFVGQLSGAVGTMAGFGDQAIEVSNRTIKKLGLDVPDVAWHASRDRMAEIVSVLAMVSATFGKIGNEVTSLQQTEKDEFAEGFTPGSVGSSTMPHKRNPGGPEGIHTLARLVKSNMSATFESMFSEHERDGALWKIEWKTVNEAVILTGAVLAKAKKLLINLDVKENKMRENLDILKGLMLSEPLMFALGEKVGKQSAHEIIYEISMETFEQHAYFIDKLLENEIVAKNLTREEIEGILDPEKYVGQSKKITEAVVENIKAARQND